MPWLVRILRPLALPGAIAMRTLAWHFRKKNAALPVAGVRIRTALELPHPVFSCCTRRFAAFLRSARFEGLHVLEVDSGSGLLAILAARSGAASVRAIDSNPAAVQNMRHNAADNHTRITCLEGALFSPLDPKSKFDRIICNTLLAGAMPEERLAHFLRQAPSHLAERGQIWLLIDPISHPDLRRTFATLPELTQLSMRRFFCASSSCVLITLGKKSR